MTSAVNANFSTIFTPAQPPAAGQETVTNTQVDPGIDATIQSQPYNFLLGTANWDGGSAINDGAAVVDPVTDGAPYSTVAGADGAPSDLGSNGATAPSSLDPKVFTDWTSEQQSEYLNYWLPNNNGSYAFDIGSDVSGATPISAVLSQSLPGTVYVVNNLQSAQIGQISATDMAVISGTAAFAKVALQLNLSTDNSSALASIQQKLSLIEGADTTSTTTTTYNYDSSGSFTTSSTSSSTSSSNNLPAAASSSQTTDSSGNTQSTQVTLNADGTVSSQVVIQNASGQTTSVTNSTTTNSLSISTSGGAVTINNMPSADRQVFISELQALETQVNNSSVVSDSQISTDVASIMDRFNRAAVFWSQSTPSTTSYLDSSGAATGLSTGVVSQDNNASISQAYQTFMTQERQILAISQDEQSVAASGMIGSVQADAPTLAFYFMQDATSSQQAIVTADTTELEQINDLLQNYSQMQNLVNDTLSKFGADSTSTTPETLLGASGSASSLFSANDSDSSDAAIVSMFNTGTATAQSPLESLYGVSRPTQALVDPSTGNLNGYNQQQWTDFGNELSNTVTQLQQQSQTLTNQLNQETQVQNQDFAESTNILNQMNSVIQEIGANESST